MSEATSGFQAVHSKKRFREDMSMQKQLRSDKVRDTDKQSELYMLKEALKSERDSLRKLHRELEVERGASMTAANEAMAMITRLQEEKAAVLVEARRYKLAAEERENHNHEAIGLLKEALLTKEDDLLALQELLSAYRERLLRFDTEQGESLEDNDQLLLLEGPNTNLSCVDANHDNMHYGHSQGYGTPSGRWTTGNESEDFECQDEFFDSHYCSNGLRHHNERRHEGTPEGDCYSGETFGKQGIQGTIHEQLMLQSSTHSEDQKSESETLKHPEEQSLDDVSVSIFARVKRLEERFEYLRQSQPLEHQQPHSTCQFDTVILDDLEAEQRAKFNWKATSTVPCDRKARYSLEPEGLPAEDIANGDLREPEEVLKCLSFEKVRMDVRNVAQEQCCFGYHGGAGSGSKSGGNMLNVQRFHDERSTLYAESNDDESEGVHDVYEVHPEVKKSVVHSHNKDCSKDITGQQKFETGSLDASVFGTLQEADKGLVEVGLAVPRSYAETEACTAVVAKLSIDDSQLDVKVVHASVADEDVQQLKVRLQALEGERVSMKEAIDSLRHENKELKVLQELALQLRELNIDARRNELVGQPVQPPLFTFFKGVLSFTGCRSPASTKGNRCLLHPCSFSNKERQHGLLHILEKGSESPKSVCVTRERRVKLDTT